MARTKDFNEEEVLEKALHIFWQKGYNGTSMQELVDGLGISRSSMYDTYTDKYTLFIKALERYSKNGFQELKQKIDQAPSSKAAIKNIFQMIVDESLFDKDHHGCFAVNACTEKAPDDKIITRIFNENLQTAEEFFYEVVTKGQESGEIANRTDARALARFLINNISGIRVAAKAGVDKKVYDDIVNVALSVLE